LKKGQSLEEGPALGKGFYFLKKFQRDFGPPPAL
jgi:hypothetical protein